jgi:hypothetical protein
MDTNFYTRRMIVNDEINERLRVSRERRLAAEIQQGAPTMSTPKARRSGQWLRQLMVRIVLSPR